MNIILLRNFVQVADTLDFGRAAAALAIPRSNLNASIAQLEAEVGIELFERVDGGVRLTDAGVAILADAREELANPTAATSARRGQDGGQDGGKPTGGQGGGKSGGNSSGGKAKASKGKGRAPAVKGQAAPGKRRQSR
ncbi:MAG: LysR family transcriptional regulator [Burkholderiaceae bacterium]|nr:LysR family transcriptional regulator [Microbacteriaceae bacterium]